MNIPAIFVAALIPILVGFVWYNPRTFGNAWMKAAGISPEHAAGANMPLIFGLTYVFSVLLALIMATLVIHQTHIYSALVNQPGFGDPDSEVGQYIAGFMEKYGNNFRTFKHGLYHGTTAGVLIALPVLGVNALFERKSFRYIAINAGFWIVCLALMGGVISAWK